MEALLTRQKEIIQKIQQVRVNFIKDSAGRKTPEYIRTRLEAVRQLWSEFVSNDARLAEYKDEDQPYFAENVFEQAKISCEEVHKLLATFEQPGQAVQSLGESGPEGSNEVGELLKQQKTNFRAFSRLIKGIKVDAIVEKWEFDDEIQNVQSRWAIIDKLHLQIDNVLQGSDKGYDEEFEGYEIAYKEVKRKLHAKLGSVVHKQQATPQLEIPVFMGKYTQWPTFYDLFKEAVHNNKSIQKAQKMQHLKGKLKGEAERLIQHLNVSSENYDVAWELLTRRYNNPQVLFANHMEIFLNQPTIYKQSSVELKRLHDTSMECINAIRNLGMDTSAWGPILVHLLLKKIDQETCSDFKEFRKSPRDVPTFEEFMGFLENKFTALEPIVQKREKEWIASSGSKKSLPYQGSFNYRQNYQGRAPLRVYQAAPAMANKCPLCNLEHDLFKCRKFRMLAPESRLRAVVQHRVCQNCLYKHYGNQCSSNRRCRECDGGHNTLLHNAYSRPTFSSAHPAQSTISTMAGGSRSGSRPHNVSYVASDSEEVLLTTISLKVQAESGEFIILRALLDQGSQISLISENAAQLLGLRRHSYNASIAGIGNGASQSKGMVVLRCQSIHDDYQFSTEALVISRVVNSLPNVSFNKQSIPFISNIKLADPEYNISRPVDFLLDATVYSRIIMESLIKNPGQNVIAQQTRLGWILSGNVKTFNCHVVLNNLADISKYWELEDIITASSVMTPQEQFCEDFYQRTTTRLENGAYVVGIPMKIGFEQKLGLTKPKALAQFRQMENKLQRNQQLGEQYKQFINEYQSLGHMRKAESAAGPSCFLPHHFVLKFDSTTTKLRVVFNASAKSSSGHSLNDLMECGPNLQQDLQTLILNWRQYKYVVTADIEKMFRTIYVREADQQLQKIIWRDSVQDPLQEYCLSTVTYGTKSAPFIAMRTLRQLAMDDAHLYPLAATALQSSFYMDDLLAGGNSMQETKELQQQLVEMLKGAGMNLRKWSSNEPQIISGLAQDQIDTPLDFRCSESRKTLGLQWNAATDCFTFRNKLEVQSNKCHTKRQLLSDISKIFDPLGWLAPLTVKAKLLFQKAWTAGMAWDDQLSEAVQSEWNRLRDDMRHIDNFSIVRHLGDTGNILYLHGFCDASERVYSAAVYITTNNEKEGVTARLVMAKTKLAPLNKAVSLPRLELCGAVLLSQLMNKVIESISCLSKQNIKICAWTDSMVVLGWLKGDISRWKQFVANRVQQVTSVIEPGSWYHVRSEDNAADCATRGLTSAQLLEQTIWWEGPKWLLQFKHDDINPTCYEVPQVEVKKHNVHAAVCQEVNFITRLLDRHESITRVVRTLAWISRFITQTRSKQNIERAGYLTSAELNIAWNVVIKFIQGNCFSEEISSIERKGHVSRTSRIVSLNPFLDKEGVLRVGGRLANASISEAAKHTIILPSHGRLTQLIIEQGHKTTLHGRARLTLSYLRNKYWIIGGMCTVKRVLRRCVRCKRFEAVTRPQIMADLPAARVTPGRTFENTGVDFTGYFELKASTGRGIRTTKGYVAIFVCMATKAVHLELVSDLSTPAFLAAFRRFCSRRGDPRHMYSDNGTNFVGCNRVLRKEYQEIIRNIDSQFFNNISHMDIEWHFNAPAWSSAGGLWEAAVRSFKYHLRRVIGDQRLTYEEFNTLIQQIEACLNSRPLGPLTENPEDEVLTAGHFLVGGPLLNRPQTDSVALKLTARWQLVQALNKQLWKRWSAEYLQQLQARSKWRTPCKNLQRDDVVLVKDDNMPPGKWPLARVMEVHPGRDGYVRVVTLKTQNSIIKRPVTKLVVLPVTEDPSGSEQGEARQRSERETSCTTARDLPPRGRRGKPLFRGLFTTLLLLGTMISPTVSTIITALDSSQGLYFDKMSNLQHVRDEWKLVVYYNMTAYWKDLSEIRGYVEHLNEFISASDLGNQYRNIALQLQHELSEIDHMNALLKYKSRRKRGLIDGVGYIANSLFGVLDERFAEQYEKDILQISQNEGHLQKLLKNQTSIIEAEYNILRRHENIIKQQFALVRKDLDNLSETMEKTSNVIRREFYITSSALAAYATLANIRGIQQTLMDSLIDLNQGRIDPHLLGPEQLQEQVNIVAGQLQGDLTLPVREDNIRDLYRLSGVTAKAYNNYLIIEIRVPIVSSDIFEMDKVISIPFQDGRQMHETVPMYPYFAFNLKKDAVLFLSEHDLTSCTHVTSDSIICSINKPVYNFNIKQSICDLNIIGAKASLCQSTVSACTDKWVKLRRRNVWLYSCCEECKIRIFCATGAEVRVLKGNGIVELGQGCMLKSETFTIHGHNNFVNKMGIEPFVEVPTDTSMLNDLINSTVARTTLAESNASSEPTFDQLRLQLEQLKEQAETQMVVHNVHHYTALYVVIIAAVAAACAVAYWRRSSRQRPGRVEAAARPRAEAPAADASDSAVKVEKKGNTVISDKRGTAPSKASRMVEFDGPYATAT